MKKKLNNRVAVKSGYYFELFDKDERKIDSMFGEKLRYSIDDYIVEKPKCKLVGENGNIYNLMGIAYKALKRNGQEEDAKEILYSFENLLASEDINIIKEVAFYRNNFLNRIKLLFNKDYKIANFVDNFWSKIRVLIGHL